VRWGSEFGAVGEGSPTGMGSPCGAIERRGISGEGPEDRLRPWLEWTSMGSQEERCSWMSRLGWGSVGGGYRR
jgi:hypothetical protein